MRYFQSNHYAQRCGDDIHRSIDRSGRNGVTLKASSVSDSTKTASAVITIEAPASISVTLNPTPPASLSTSASASLTAVVTNDPAHEGVSWSVSCGTSGNCGSFTPTSTAGGSATTYQAPTVVPAGNTVTIKATSVADTTKSASATIPIEAEAAAILGDGNYVFSAAGSNTNSQSYVVAGVFTVSSGAITGGEQDYVDSTPISDTHDALNPAGSSITTTADGNLQITLTTCLGVDCTQVDPVINGGVVGVETFNGTPISTSTCGTAGGPCTAKLVEFDANTSSGTLELQSSTAAPAGSYAFGATGAAGFPVAVGGILSVSGTTISTTGTVFDLNQGGVTISSNQSISAGLVTAPDATGRLQVSMTPTNSVSLPTLAFAAYLVDANHIRILAASFPLAGVAYLQNTASLAVAGQTYVVSTTGSDPVGDLQLAGVLTLASGSTGVTGTISYNDGANAIQPAGTVTGGTYVADTTFLGRVTITGVTDGSGFNPNTFNLQLYVDGNGNALALSLGPSEVMGGVGYVQTGGGSFAAGSLSGAYALNLSGYDGSGIEYDAVGPISADGVGALSSPTIDLNLLGVPLYPGYTCGRNLHSRSDWSFPRNTPGLGRVRWNDRHLHVLPGRHHESSGHRSRWHPVGTRNAGTTTIKIIHLFFARRTRRSGWKTCLFLYHGNRRAPNCPLKHFSFTIRRSYP